MALSFLKKDGSADVSSPTSAVSDTTSKPWDELPDQEVKSEAESAKSKPSQGTTSAPTKGGGLSFLKKGARAKQALALETKRKEQLASNVNRFWLPKDNDTQITFLDGNLDEDGFLDAWYWLEHNAKIQGKYGNYFVCIREEEPCPLCDMGNPSLVAGLSIIDHTAFESKVTGKIVRDRVALFVCKATTYQLLQKLAAKRGGLAGCTFDVSRTGDMSPSVGSMFDFVEKNPVESLIAKYSTGDKKIEIPDIESIITKQYRTGDELKALGFGNSTIGGGSANASAGAVTDYTNLM